MRNRVAAEKRLTWVRELFEAPAEALGRGLLGKGGSARRILPIASEPPPFRRTNLIHPWYAMAAIVGGLDDTTMETTTTCPSSSIFGPKPASSSKENHLSLACCLSLLQPQLLPTGDLKQQCSSKMGNLPLCAQGHCQQEGFPLNAHEALHQGASGEGGCPHKAWQAPEEPVKAFLIYIPALSSPCVSLLGAAWR